jgi:hypothetical protein
LRMFGCQNRTAHRLRRGGCRIARAGQLARRMGPPETAARCEVPAMRNMARGAWGARPRLLCARHARASNFLTFKSSCRRERRALVADAQPTVSRSTDSSTSKLDARRPGRCVRCGPTRHIVHATFANATCDPSGVSCLCRDFLPQPPQSMSQSLNPGNLDTIQHNPISIDSNAPPPRVCVGMPRSDRRWLLLRVSS